MVLEVLGMLESALVEDENVRESGADEIVHQTENPASRVSLRFPSEYKVELLTM